jgi:hypothetical protein
MEKKKVMYKLMIALLMFFVTTGALHAGDNVKTKRILKSYPVSPSTYIELDNKYGDIEVNLWDKDSVKFEITITVHSDKEEELNKMLDQVKIDIKATPAFVIVNTDWSEEVGVFKKGIIKINQEIVSNTKYTINYKLTLPEKTELSITNKFGNIFMSNYIGKLSVNLSYGDLRAHKLSNVKELNAKYGKVKIKELSYGRINLQSVKPFDVDKCLELDMESSSSEIEIDQLKNLTLSSSHDEINIGKVNSFTVSSSMSDISVEDVLTKFYATSKYGSIKLLNVNASSENITIEATKTEVDVKIPSDLNANTELIFSDKSYLSNNSQFFKEGSSEVDANGYQHTKGSINDGGGTVIFIQNINGYIVLEANE